MIASARRAVANAVAAEGIRTSSAGLCERLKKDVFMTGVAPVNTCRYLSQIRLLLAANLSDVAVGPDVRFDAGLAVNRLNASHPDG